MSSILEEAILPLLSRRAFAVIALATIALEATRASTPTPKTTIATMTSINVKPRGGADLAILHHTESPQGAVITRRQAKAIRSATMIEMRAA